MKIGWLVLLMILVAKSVQSECNKQKLQAQATAICSYQKYFNQSKAILFASHIACLYSKGQIQSPGLAQMCFALDMVPVPFVSSACDIAKGIKSGKVEDVVMGGVFLTLDVVSFGLGEYVKAGGQSLKKIAKQVQDGVDLKQKVKVGWKQFKNFKRAAEELQNLQRWKSGIGILKQVVSMVDLSLQYVVGGEQKQVEQIKEFLNEFMKCSPFAT